MRRVAVCLLLFAGCDSQTASYSPTESAIRAWCQNNFNDPDGLEIVEMTKPEPIDGGKIFIAARIRSRTPLGGKVLREYGFHFKGGKLVSGWKLQAGGWPD